jgi:hypothetical protein
MTIVKTRVFAALAGLLLLIGGAALAQRPRQNVSPGRHPNIAAAQCRSQVESSYSQPSRKFLIGGLIRNPHGMFA